MKPRQLWRALSLALSFVLTLPCMAAESSINPHVELDYLLTKIEPRRLLLVGEVHGTAETPAHVAELAQQVAIAERLLIVGLEIPRDEQARVEAYMDSAGTADDRTALLAGAFWQREYQDGRSSVAMFELIEKLRVLSLRTPLRVLAFDISADPTQSGAQRDQQMAERISAALTELPEARALVLAGNFHTRIQGHAPWDPKYRFMGYHLRAFDPYSIEILAIAGDAWICTGSGVESCKSRQTPENTLQPGLELGDEINDRGHHGLWRIALSHASAPAKDAFAE